MNTFSYLSSLFSPSPRVAQAPAPPSADEGPTTIDTDTESAASETLYLSARRPLRAGDRPTVTLSHLAPAHLVGVALFPPTTIDEGESGDEDVRRAERLPLPDSPVLGGSSDEEGDEWDKKGEQSEYAQGERKLLARREAAAAVRAWPVRLSVGLYLLLRHVLSYFGFPPPAPLVLPTTPILVPPTPTTDRDELFSALAPPSPSPGRRSTFFLRRAPIPTPDLSPLPSPALAPVAPPRPPRLTPKTLVLDLDETLIHSTSRPYASSGRGAGLKVRVVEVVLEGRSTVYTVYKRPWVDFFLRKVSAWYTVIIFTASLPEYADPVIDWLDGGDGGGGMVGGRLFRSDCRHANGAYVKDLSVVDADLSRVCLVDNSPASYAINQANGIPIEGWINDPNDECLLDLLPMLDSLRFTSDVRRVLGLRGFGK